MFKFSLLCAPWTKWKECVVSMKNKLIYLGIIILLLFLLCLEQVILPKINFANNGSEHIYKIDKYV